MYALAVREDTGQMSDHDDFAAWVASELYEAEFALHNGDPAPRRRIWSRNDPVSVLGAWRDAHGQQELDDLFATLGKSFSDCVSYAFDLQVADVKGDLAYTAGLERISTSVDGEPRSFTLRATQIYRREEGTWKVVHRHADTLSSGA
jgi:ketosteroid isomerase-like protein